MEVINIQRVVICAPFTQRSVNGASLHIRNLVKMFNYLKVKVILIDLDTTFPFLYKLPSFFFSFTFPFVSFFVLMKIKIKKSDILWIRGSINAFILQIFLRLLRKSCILLFDMNSIELDERKIRECNGAHLKLISYAESKVISNFHIIRVHTRSFASVISKRFRIRNGKILILPVVIDINDFRPLHKIDQIQRNNKIIGYMGSYSPWQKVENLIEAFKHLKKSEYNVDLLFIGKRFAGVKSIYVNHDDLKLLLFKLTMMVIPLDQRSSIAIPMRLIEAMACGVPIVIPKTPTIVEIMNSSNGCVTPTASPKDLMNGMIKILNLDEKILNEIKENNIRNAKDYDFRKVARIFSRFLQILNDNKQQIIHI